MLLVLLFFFRKAIHELQAEYVQVFKEKCGDSEPRDIQGDIKKEDEKQNENLDNNEGGVLKDVIAIDDDDKVDQFDEERLVSKLVSVYWHTATVNHLAGTLGLSNISLGYYSVLE